MVAFSAAGNAGTSAVVVGPSGVVTNQGAIGPHGSGVGLGHYAAGLGYNNYGFNNVGGVSGVGLGLGLHGVAGLANGLYGAGYSKGLYGAGYGNGLYGSGYSNGLYTSGLGISLGSGHGLGLYGGAGLGLGYGQGLSGLVVPGYGYGGYGHGSYGTGLVGAGLNAVTPGGGRIEVSHAGAIVQGPSTAPAVIAGPSGKISTNGLWGPTANIGLAAGYGNVAHGW